MAGEIIFSAIIIIGFLLGLRLQQSPATAVWGNRLAALSMAAAIVYTAYLVGILTDPIIWIIIGGTALVGIFLAGRVKMIQMPQIVALLNGFGGAASALVAGTSSLYDIQTTFAWFTAALALGVGTFTLSGSVVAALKLQSWITEKSVQLTGQQFLQTFLLLLMAVLVGAMTATGSAHLMIIIPIMIAAAAIYGVLVAMRVGGADMPIIISLLNSFSGMAAAISGFAVENVLLVSAGAIVGVTGLLLTRIMCEAMNRSLFTVLRGFSPDQAASTEADDEAIEETSEDEIVEDKEEFSPEQKISQLIDEAQDIIIVPGYGMAVAQAQEDVKEMLDLMDERGKSVDVAIHPVAGRMPGHMNVLLAEVGVDHDRLKDLEEINDDFADTDLVIIVGACDVVNPAAKKADGSPISGMPVLNAEEAGHVVILNLDDEPGYSGVENPLYDEDFVIPFWGDAAETVPRLVEITREGVDVELEKEAPDETGAEDIPEEENPEERAVDLMKESERIIIVPGYGMAVAQAQEDVKEMLDLMDERGKSVDVAIHPVAGRMPGHMNVLLAEVGVDHDRLKDLEEINDDFADTDLVIIVGACDVVNPAAKKADGSPISGMPVLNAEEAGHVVILNLDDEPGYSGVENPLYDEEFVVPIWGDAAETVPSLVKKMQQ